MDILENSNVTKTSPVAVIIMVSYKEARILNDAIEEYVKNNKRKVIAKKMFKQFYKELPY